MNTMNAIFYAAGVIGGLVLHRGTFCRYSASRSAMDSHCYLVDRACVCRLGCPWLKFALGSSGPVTGFVRNFKTTSGGIAIGILGLLFASGEFRGSIEGRCESTVSLRVVAASLKKKETTRS